MITRHLAQKNILHFLPSNNFFEQNSKTEDKEDIIPCKTELAENIKHPNNMTNAMTYKEIFDARLGILATALFSPLKYLLSKVPLKQYCILSS